ncbi:hypothetical protein I4U23_027286 [Adineta vaga]|nr:hypothetical protein I4U23_027286 [Adineta vaga]
MAQSSTITICQMNCDGIRAGMKTVTILLAILHRYNFEIKPVSVHPGSILYVCTHRESGVDANLLQQEMMVHIPPGGKTPVQNIQLSFA